MYVLRPVADVILCRNWHLPPTITPSDHLSAVCCHCLLYIVWATTNSMLVCVCLCARACLCARLCVCVCVCVIRVLRRIQQYFSHITTVAACCMWCDGARVFTALYTDVQCQRQQPQLQHPDTNTNATLRGCLIKPFIYNLLNCLGEKITMYMYWPT